MADEDHNTIDAWVLHSPYPDGTWRGVEKCATSESGAPLLFSSEEEAAAFLEEHMPEGLMVPVRVALQTPLVRHPLDRAAPRARVEGGTMRVRAYNVLDEAVEAGVHAGWRRAHKHEKNPSEEAVLEHLAREVMTSICERFEFDD